MYKARHSHKAVKIIDEALDTGIAAKLLKLLDVTDYSALIHDDAGCYAEEGKDDDSDLLTRCATYRNKAAAFAC